MDPVTAFSIACGVIQVVSFSLRLMSKSKELYEKGSLEQNDSLENLAHHLSDLKVELDRPFISPGGAHSQDEQDLQQLADKCSKTAQELLWELSKLKVSESNRRRQVIKVSVRAVLKRNPLKDIEGRLKSYRDVLNTRILLALRYVWILKSQISRRILRFALPIFGTGNNSTQ